MSRPPVTTAVDAVASELRTAILCGSPAPGDRLPEEVLAARFEVARHTLRAALRLLASEGLVVVRAHRGACVARLEGEDLRALFELRTALEVEAARLLAARDPAADWPDVVRSAAAELERRCTAADPGITPAAPADASQADASQADASQADASQADASQADASLVDRALLDRALIDEAHLALHHALVAAAGSPRITAAHAALAAEQRLVLRQSRSTLDPARMAAHHRALLTDLHRVGPDALRAHLADGRTFSTTPSP